MPKSWRQRALEAEAALEEQQDDIDEALGKLDLHDEELNDLREMVGNAQGWFRKSLDPRRQNIPMREIAELADCLGFDFRLMMERAERDMFRYQYAPSPLLNNPSALKGLITGV